MNYKVCVYAICKNESKFILDWYESVKDADYVCVLDTGSDDNSFELLKSLNIITKQVKFSPWRFDTARNESLNLVPTDADILVCTDLDEFWQKGWVEKLKNAWHNGVGRARYEYIWNFDELGRPATIFYTDKIHANHKYKWIYPVHEILTPTTDENLQTITVEGLSLHHHADNKKSRSSYLPLLELSVKEFPKSDRNMHYLGREYMFHGQYENAIKTLKKHLKMQNSTWADERSASLRFISRCYEKLGNFRLAKKFLLKAIVETPKLREPFYELALLYYNKKDYLSSLATFESMLNIKDRELNYISEPNCWNETCYDYMSICAYYLGLKNKAIYYCNQALQIKYDERIANNLSIIQNSNMKTR